MSYSKNSTSNSRSSPIGIRLYNISLRHIHIHITIYIIRRGVRYYQILSVQIFRRILEGCCRRHMLYIACSGGILLRSCSVYYARHVIILFYYVWSARVILYWPCLRKSKITNVNASRVDSSVLRVFRIVYRQISSLEVFWC